MREILLDNISIKSNCRALEIGCGIGRLLKPLSRFVSELYGVDISTEMIAQAKERLASCKNIILSVCDGSLTNFPDNHFDFCYSLAAFRHIPEKKYVYRYLSEASRVLKPAGVFIFEVWGAGRIKSRNKGGTIVGVSFKEREMLARLKEFGFQVLEVDKKPGLPYVIYKVIRNSKPGKEATNSLMWIS